MPIAAQQAARFRTGDGGSPKAPLWQGELPLRRRGGLHETTVLSYSEGGRTGS